MTEKVKPTTTTPKRASSRTSKPRRRKPSHDEISERAYYLHLHQRETDPVDNWLQAELELTAA
jgi:hypothetical protein